MEQLEIINGDDKSISNFHQRGWGRTTIELTKDQLSLIVNELKEGKALAYDDGEYTMVIKLK